MRTAGRKPAALGETAPRNTPQTKKEVAYNLLFPKDTSVVECQLCHEMVPDIDDHLIDGHPAITLDFYVAEFPKAPLKGVAIDTPQDKFGENVPQVSAAEAAKHPGGRDAAIVEKMLDTKERRGYRESVVHLLSQGFPAGYAVASLAYKMVIAGRLRHQVERLRTLGKGQVIDGDSLKLLEAIEKAIADQLRDLQKIKEAAKDTGLNPMDVIERALAAAEVYVQTHIGEHVDACPHCRGILTPPALPHWAFEPNVRKDGQREWAVWSQELWRLVTLGAVPLWVMAFTLRTSPEGLMLTARRRGLAWPEWIMLEQEERELRAAIDRWELEQRTSGRPTAATPVEGPASAASSPSGGPPDPVPEGEGVTRDLLL